MDTEYRHPSYTDRDGPSMVPVHDKMSAPGNATIPSKEPVISCASSVLSRLATPLRRFRFLELVLGAERGAIAGVDETADETVAEADDDVDAEVALLLWVGLTWALLL